MHVINALLWKKLTKSSTFEPVSQYPPFWIHSQGGCQAPRLWPANMCDSASLLQCWLVPAKAAIHKHQNTQQGKVFWSATSVKTFALSQWQGGAGPGHHPLAPKPTRWQNTGSHDPPFLLSFRLYQSWLASRGNLPDGSVGKESVWNAGNTGDVGLIPGSGRSSERGNGNPLQYSCLKKPMDRVTSRAIVQRLAKSQTRLSD